MAEKYELAYRDYKAGMKQKDIAAKYDVSINTVKSWQQRKWKEMDAEGASEKVCAPKQKGMHTKKVPTIDDVDDIILTDIGEPVMFEDEPSDNKQFTDKQRLFISFYVKYWNATKAYQKAYQCDYETAKTNGNRLLTKANIKAEVERVRDSITGDALLTKRVLIQKWMDIAFADITDYVQFGREEEIMYDEEGLPKIDANGNPKTQTYSYVHLNDSAEVDGTLITEVKQGRDGISIKLADKMTALKYLSQHLDVLNEREKKWLQEEQMRLNIDKSKVELEALKKNDGNQVTKVVFVDDISGDADDN